MLPINDSSNGHIYERDAWVKFVCRNCGRDTKLREHSVRGMHVIRLLTPCLRCRKDIFVRAIKVQDVGVFNGVWLKVSAL